MGFFVRVVVVRLYSAVDLSRILVEGVRSLTWRKDS